MSILVDTNILVRFLDGGSTHRSVCVDALRIAKASNGQFVICAQVAIEFLSVATRPATANGLGLIPFDADAALHDFGKFLPVIAEPPDVLVRWRQLVLEHGVRGRAAHDARLAALMISGGIEALLTLNPSDFNQYRQFRVISPHDVVAGKM